jgi:hypothetical protein
MGIRTGHVRGIDLGDGDQAVDAGAHDEATQQEDGGQGHLVLPGPVQAPDHRQREDQDGQVEEHVDALDALDKGYQVDAVAGNRRVPVAGQRLALHADDNQRHRAPQEAEGGEHVGGELELPDGEQPAVEEEQRELDQRAGDGIGEFVGQEHLEEVLHRLQVVRSHQEAKVVAATAYRRPCAGSVHRARRSREGDTYRESAR